MPTDQPEKNVLAEASRSLFRLGRAFGRLPMRELLEVRAERGTELSSILVVQAAEAGEAAGRDVTVGFIAAHLGVDPSTASRLVAQAVQSGYLGRAALESDRRATALELTVKGRALGTGAAQYQRAVFDAATARWSDRERQEFARLFIRFADAIVPALNADREVRE